MLQFIFAVLMGALLIFHGRLMYRNPKIWMERWQPFWKVSRAKWRMVRYGGVIAIVIGLFIASQGLLMLLMPSNTPLMHGILLALCVAIAFVLLPRQRADMNIALLPGFRRR